MHFGGKMIVKGFKKFKVCFVYGMITCMLSTMLSIQMPCCARQIEGGKTITNKQEESLGKKQEESNAFSVDVQSFVLMEKKSGMLICDKNKNQELMPASITKIMTILLIFDALQEKKIHIDDVVQISKHAASMGGSQVYLEEGEEQTVGDLLKCIVIASANDACVAMAEYISGNEEKFVEKMNAKAQKLHMNHTVFSNCCGLDDTLSEGQHHTSAYDIALMSRALLLQYPQVSKYSTTWMDTITHRTRKGEKEFGLTNTNKLVRTYQGITGLKTGSTAKAKFCLSASAKRNNMELIAVVMGAPTPNARFEEAAKLLNYGFQTCHLYIDTKKVRQDIAVKQGKSDWVMGEQVEKFSYICCQGEKPEHISKQLHLEKHLQAPVKKGQKIGNIIYYYQKKPIGHIAIVAKENVKKAKYGDYINRLMKLYANIS